MSTITSKPIPGDFTGRIGRLIFTSRQAFERAVPNYIGLRRHKHAFKVGETVYLDYDGRTVAADVWADGPKVGSYWLRGDDGVTYLVGRKSGGWREVTPTDHLGRPLSKSEVRTIRGAA